MADVVRIQSRSLALTTGEASRERWLVRLVGDMRRARRRKYEDFLRLYPKGSCTENTMHPFYEEAVRHGGGLF